MTNASHWLAELDDVDQPQLRNRYDYARAARDLARQGLTEHDIADALKLTTAAVRKLLAEPVPVKPTRKMLRVLV